MLVDEELMIHYAYRLNWHLPKEQQEEAIELLAAEVPREKLPLIFLKYAKECWPNAIKVMEKVGYPQNEAAFPKLFKLFQDLNWPGAIEAVEYLKSVDKKVVANYLEKASVQAEQKGDTEWLYFLNEVREQLNIGPAYFRDKETYHYMLQSHRSEP